MSRQTFYDVVLQNVVQCSSILFPHFFLHLHCGRYQAGVPEYRLPVPALPSSFVAWINRMHFTVLSHYEI